ncbi:MAG: hypothetical protein P0Y49_04675 [Candidatus Pedobacter colombiensis]|uniref:Uncharacterized protein n=1 Tax=Candidatus Pedobacter colombiensis TaxID=3121371 RepID=A0AAJ6B8E7_9SPHI|nr:hypothetical protein [Pedobacter sp.]WEK20431.1 MAG: hypothetical protein P0Y49_04675 [Pedobacter sp.]
MNHSEGSYSVADDTLMIRQLEGIHYQITRRTGFNRMVDGKSGLREYEMETWSGLYDAEAGVINESRYGKVLSFFPDSGLLRVSNRVYKKIK